jgi:hypothetical protein
MGLALLGQQDFTGARDCFQKGLAQMVEYGSRFGESRLRAGLCRAYLKLNQPQEFSAAAARVRSAAEGPYFDHLACLALMEGEAALAASAPAERIGDCFVDALAQALGHNIYLLDEIVEEIIGVLTGVEGSLAGGIVSRIAAAWARPEGGTSRLSRETSLRLEETDEDARRTHQATVVERLRQCQPEAVAAAEASPVPLEPDVRPADQPVAGAADDRGEEPSFDVFISYKRSDMDEAKAICASLRAAGIRPWLDIEQLPPGSSWISDLEKYILHIPTAAVLVGKEGIGPWQGQEIEALLVGMVERGAKIIPVLLKSALREPAVPPLLQTKTYVDLRQPDPDPMGQLVWGITGKRQNQSAGHA